MSQRKPMKLLKMLTGIGVLTITVNTNIIAAEDCEPAHNFETIEDGVLTVTSTTVPPYSYPGGDGKLHGTDAEILEIFADRECLEIESKVVDASSTIQYVISGRSDVAIGGWYRTAKRAEKLGITDPIYVDQAAIYSKQGFTEFSQLEGKAVGTVQGYLWVDDMRGIYGESLKLYPDPTTLVQDLAAGRIDAAVNTYPIGMAAKERGSLPDGFTVKVVEPDERVESSIRPAQTGFLYTKSNDALGKALNDTIADLKKNDRIKPILKAHNVKPSAADTGEPRVIGE